MTGVAKDHFGSKLAGDRQKSTDSNGSGTEVHTDERSGPRHPAVDPQRSASLSQYLSQTGRSALTLKVCNVVTISMVTAPAVDQERVLPGGSFQASEKIFSQSSFHEAVAQLSVSYPDADLGGRKV